MATPGGSLKCIHSFIPKVAVYMIFLYSVTDLLQVISVERGHMAAIKINFIFTH